MPRAAPVWVGRRVLLDLEAVTDQIAVAQVEYLVIGEMGLMHCQSSQLLLDLKHSLAKAADFVPLLARDLPSSPPGVSAPRVPRVPFDTAHQV